MMRLAIAATVVVLLGATAHANTRRIAVVVGNNTGNPGRVALHYAELDAAKFAQVLGELGGVAPSDLFVLQGKSATAVGETFARVKGEIARFHTHPENRVVVVFYFSGHSDGEALELGADRMTFSAVRQALASLGADVRVVLVDSCKSGALLQAKGGRPGPAFQIRMTDELASTGEALLTSSASDEVALESRSIQGSYFTHHLISGLRGAADASGDGLVTLAEAYQYAYARTVKTTGDTVVGPQHPAYDYRLTGQGELTLSELGKRTATLELPGGFERIVVIDAARDRVVAEVMADTHVRIGAQTGRYAIHAARDGKLFAVEVAIVNGVVRTVRADELSVMAIEATASKGDATPSPWQLSFSSGARTGVALRAAPGARVELVVPSGISFALDASSGTGAGFRESSIAVSGGLRAIAARSAWSGWLGAEAGGGIVLQTGTYSTMLSLGAVAGVAFALTPRTSIQLQAVLPVELVKRDLEPALLFVPSGWLGVGVRL